jgi:chorismate mutase
MTSPDTAIEATAAAVDAGAEHTIPMMQQSRVSQVVGRARAYAAEHGLSEGHLDGLCTRIIAETCAEEDRLISELTRGARP